MARGRTRKVYAQERPDIRPESRPAHAHDDDPRARAAARAAEIEGSLGSYDSFTDKFAAPPAPAGWSYEWKRHTLLNQEDPTYQRQLESTGWTPVPTARHVDMMPNGSKDAVIKRDGMILMERPEVITNRFREDDKRRARAQVRAKEEALTSVTSDEFKTNAHPNTRARISHSHEPLPIPKDTK